MSVTYGSNLGLMLTQTQGDTPWNEPIEDAFALLDVIVHLDVIQRSLNTPPGSPTNGDRYHIGASPTGAWASNAGDIAVRQAGAWVFIEPKEGWLITSQADDYKIYKYQDGAFVDATREREVIIVACSDETTAIVAATGVVKFRMPFAMTLTAVRASLGGAAATGTFTVDINESGTTILSTKLTIDATEKTSTTAAAAAVISDANLADDAEISFDIDDDASGDATGLKVYLIGVRA